MFYLLTLYGTLKYYSVICRPADHIVERPSGRDSNPGRSILFLSILSGFSLAPHDRPVLCSCWNPSVSNATYLFSEWTPGHRRRKGVRFDLIFYIELSIITGIYFNLAILRTRWVFLIIDYIFVRLFSPHMLILKFICKTVKSWKVLYGRYIIFLFFLLLSDYICKIAIVYYWLGKNYVIVAFLYKKENLP